MKKRGTLTLKALTEIIIAALVIFIFISIAKSFGTGEQFYKIKANKDIALLVDTLHAVPGNAYIAYPLNISGISIGMSSNKVKLFENNIEPLGIEYPFVGNGEIDDSRVDSPTIVYISKVGSRIIITKDQPPDISIQKSGAVN